MKKLFTILFCACLMVSGALSLGACGSTETSAKAGTESKSSAEAEAETENGTVSQQVMADGVYALDAFSFSGGSGKVTIECPQVRVEQGEVFADLVFSSSHYQYVKVDGVQYDPVEAFARMEIADSGKVTLFEIPVTTEADQEIVAMTTAMSQAHEITYTLHIGTLAAKTDDTADRDAAGSLAEGDAAGDGLAEGDAASGLTGGDPAGDGFADADTASAAQASLPAFDPQDFPALTYDHTMENQYARCFAVHYFAEGHKLLDIAGGGRFLLLPEGEGSPAELPSDVTVLARIPSRIYLAATAVMSFYEAIGAEDAVTMTGTDAAGWQIEGPGEALAEGRMIYMGKYSQPDYEGLTAGGCDLAIESTMILHTPEVEGKLTELGIPVLIDRSSYEPEPLGRTEWIRFYGALMGRESQADEAFAREAAYAAGIRQRAATGQKIAYFAVNSSRTVDVRGGEDYIVKMIRQAGGIYAFDGLPGVDGKTSSVSISLEEFYACAADADYLVYNASIQQPLASVSALTGPYPLFSDLQAVQEGNVWQVRRSLYQSSDTACRLILDFAGMMDGAGDEDMYFLEKVGE